MTTPLNIKWLMGDADNNPMSDQSFLMLEISIRYMKLLLPEAHRHIAISYLVGEGESRVRAIAEQLDCEVYMVTEHPSISKLPKYLMSTKRRSAWWKYIPLKMGDGHTLHLDNDFIIWRIPPQMLSWMEHGGLLGYGTERDNPAPHYNPETGRLDWSKGIHFGSKVNWVKEHAGELALNSGIVGIGADISGMPVPLKQVTSWRKFVEDQAWWTVNFAMLDTVHRQVIHYQDDMPNLSKWSDYAKDKTSPREYIPLFYGAHYTTHNANHTHYFGNYCYQDFVEDLQRKGG